MIDWYDLVANSFWILALVLALATISFARQDASLHGTRLRDVLNDARWKLPLNITGALFCLGLAATSVSLWNRIVWGVLIILFLLQIWFIRNTNSRQ